MDMFFKCEVEDCNTTIADDDVEALQWRSIATLDSEDFGLQSIKKSIEMFKELYKNNTL